MTKTPSSRTFVTGDIHGASRALKQCLDRALFNNAEDRLICLGDICDGWPETNACFELLLEIKDLIYIIGNHDQWALEWAETGAKPDIWLRQGGQSTIESYGERMPASHYQLLKNAFYYYTLDDKLFVHGGITDAPLEEQGRDIFLWDRSLFQQALSLWHNGKKHEPLTDFREVYIGHTPLHRYNIFHPIKAGGVWMMDTGAGWSGVLTLMDIHSKKYYQSDPVPYLYPGVKGRAK